MENKSIENEQFAAQQTSHSTEKKSECMFRSYYIDVFYDKSIGRHNLSIPRLADTGETLCMTIVNPSGQEFRLFFEDHFVAESSNAILCCYRTPYQEDDRPTEYPHIAIRAARSAHPELFAMEKLGRGMQLTRIGDVSLEFPDRSIHTVEINVMEAPHVKAQPKVENGEIASSS